MARGLRAQPSGELASFLVTDCKWRHSARRREALGAQSKETAACAGEGEAGSARRAGGEKEIHTGSTPASAAAFTFE